MKNNFRNCFLWPLTLLTLGSFTSNATSQQRRIEEGVIRQTSEVISDSDEIYKIVVSEVKAGACTDELDLYRGRVINAFKGDLKPGSDLGFCGYAGLTTYASYVLGFNRNAGLGKLVFMPDAIYIESTPDVYFRMLSYESHEYVVNGRRAILSAFEEPEFLEKLPNAKQR